jgi:SAM-dependent methyltransferase
LLTRATGPVLDVGCGPGRHVVALAEAGVVTLGIDVSGPAVTLARVRGGSVLHRSVFARIPGAGRWGSALLLDGNLGIGGEPRVLLARVASLLRHDGRILVELDAAPAEAESRHVRFESADRSGPWFRWVAVPAGALADLIPPGLAVRERWDDGGRCFARLERTPAATP